jgi:hypothetical protein
MVTSWGDDVISSRLASSVISLFWSSIRDHLDSDVWHVTNQAQFIAVRKENTGRPRNRNTDKANEHGAVIHKMAVTRVIEED